MGTGSQRLDRVEERADVGAGVDEAALMGDPFGQLDHEPEVGVGLLRPRRHRVPGRRGVEGGVALHRVAPARVCPQSLVGRQGVRHEAALPCLEGPHRTSHVQPHGRRLSPGAGVGCRAWSSGGSAQRHATGACPGAPTRVGSPSAATRPALGRGAVDLLRRERARRHRLAGRRDQRSGVSGPSAISSCSRRRSMTSTSRGSYPWWNVSCRRGEMHGTVRPSIVPVTRSPRG